MVVLAIVEHLRSHVLKCAAVGAASGSVLIDDAPAEVAQFDLVVGIY